MIGSTIMWGLTLAPVLPKLPELVDYWEGLQKRPAYQRANKIDQKILQAKGPV
jgi:hypothetical protein